MKVLHGSYALYALRAEFRTASEREVSQGELGNSGNERGRDFEVIGEGELSNVGAKANEESGELVVQGAVIHGEPREALPERGPCKERDCVRYFEISVVES